MRNRNARALSQSGPETTILRREARPDGVLPTIRSAYRRLFGIAAALMLLIASTAAKSADPLPSWNDGPAKSAIVDFVTAVTTEGGPDFVPSAERIATFDNDGTLWVEQPMYTQFAFALDRVKALAPQHPEWASTQPFKAVLDNDLNALLASGEKGLVEIVMASHAGNTTDEFSTIVADWIARARHPKFKQPYTKLVYQPMLEVLAFLRANGFKTYIASGGGIEFMRPWSESVYGIPPEQVIGSSIKTKFEMRDGTPVLVRLPEVDFIDDKDGKPVGIQKFIGQRPIAAFGNSDGDLQMLQWATAGSGRRFGLIIHHDDADREFAYDRQSKIGRLDKALDEAPTRMGGHLHEERLEPDISGVGEEPDGGLYGNSRGSCQACAYLTRLDAVPAESQ